MPLVYDDDDDDVAYYNNNNNNNNNNNRYAGKINLFLSSRCNGQSQGTLAFKTYPIKMFVKHYYRVV